MALSWSFAERVPSDSRVELDPAGLLQPGASLGPYVIRGLIGEGSSARVYEAAGPDGERLALKVLREGVGQRQRERFQREGALLGRLQHPGIVAVRDGGEVGGLSFLAYELVEGQDLRRAFREADLPTRARALLEVAQALAAAHAQGVVHRDLKPANVLVDAAGRVRIADFGLALAQGLERLTRSGAAVGTPLYMAPEQAIGEREAVGPAADVWSLGVMLYEALTGARPFPAEGWLDLREQLQRRRPPAPRSLNPALTPAVEAVILRCLAVEPQARFPHAGALAEALGAALAEQALSPSRTPPPIPGAPRGGTPRSAPFALGRRGPFELQAILGQGGMGVVYKAWEVEAERAVAVKCITGELTGKRLTRFLREGELTASLNHPHVLRVHTAGVLDGTPYLVYELVPGARTLDTVARDLDRRGRVALLRDAARGLGYAHRQGVVHRDVKPENVLVDEGGRALVADFGLAAAEGLEKLTKTGALVGTPHYISPEALQGQRERIGPPADVWALGVMLHELLTDALPFQGQTLVELAGVITSGRVPDLPGVDRRLVAIVRRALAQDPGERYPDAEELADDLEAWLEGRSLSPSTTHVGGLPLALGGRRWFALALVLLLAVGVAVFAVTATGPPAPEPTPTEVVASRSSPTPTASATPTPTASPSQPPAAPLDAPLLRLKHGTKRVRAVFFPDGSLATGGADGRLALWGADGAPGPRITAFERGLVEDMVALGQGDVALAGNAGVVRVHGRERTQLSRLRIDDIDVHLPSGLLVAASREGLLRWRRQPDGAWKALPVLRTGKEVYRAVAVGPRGERIAVFNDLYKVRVGEYRVEIWSSAGKLLARKGLPAAIRAVAFAPGGERLLGGTNTGQLYEVDAQTAEVVDAYVGSGQRSAETALRRAPAHESNVRGVVFACGGKRVVTCSRGEGRKRNELRVWDPVTRRETQPVRWCPTPFDSLAVSPEGRRVVMGSRSGYAEVWRVE